MATSGSINLSASRDDIITEALEILGVLAEGTTPSAAQLTSCARTLNYMIKAWQADGINLFAVQQVYLFLIKNQSAYSLIGTTTDHYTASFVETTTSAAALSGASSIVVTSATGISASDKIGVYQDGTMHWTTVNGAPSGSTVTLTAPLTADVASGAVVYAYTSKAKRPMRVLESVIHDENDTPIHVGSREEYFNQSGKGTDGRVNTIYFDPQVAAPKLYVWPQTDDERHYLKLYIQRTLEDVDAAADEVDFPQEWYLPLAANLAVLLGPKYGKSLNMLAAISAMADREYQRVSGFDTEAVSIFLAPARG
jgi:hypothetical protein